MSAVWLAVVGVGCDSIFCGGSCWGTDGLFVSVFVPVPAWVVVTMGLRTPCE